MKHFNDTIHLSASDLSNHISCSHLTQLNLLEANGKIKVPVYDDPSLELLQQRGQEFEAEIIESYRHKGLTVVELDGSDYKNALSLTKQAMADGADVIYQARLQNGRWNGWADFLLKVNKPGKLGGWSYEVMDTKLAKETRAGTILQLCLYTQMISGIQGVLPEFMYVKNPETEICFRVDDFMAYFRLIQKRLEESIRIENKNSYPEPTSHCDICKWWTNCNQQRRADDHLSFIAGMGASQIKEVNGWKVNTLQEMAKLPLPLPYKPITGSVETYTRLREQARLQLQARITGKPAYEMLELRKELGLYMLPEPSEGDIFLDFEGDPFVGSSGREYLLGYVYNDTYYGGWAFTDAEEKKIFEDFVDHVVELKKQYPGMRIYHFAPYEIAALKRLMCKYATREEEVDNMLRAEMFVDLHTVAKQSIRAGVESYSLKELEKFHRFTRIRDLKLVGKHKNDFELFLEAGTPDLAPKESKQIVEDYNKEDCLSTLSLRNWMEELRQKTIDAGFEIPRPEIKDGVASENITAQRERIRPIYDKLMLGLPIEKSARNNEQQARWLLAQMLDWYRREEKSYWWEFYRFKQLTDEDMLDEKAGIGYLSFTGNRTPVQRSVIDRYRFPMQETEIKVGDRLKSESGQDIGTVESIDTSGLTIDIRKGPSRMDIHPSSIFFHELIPQKVKEEGVIRFANNVGELENVGSVESPEVSGQVVKGEVKLGESKSLPKVGHIEKRAYQCSIDLLMRSAPRISAPYMINTDAQITAVNWLDVLDHSVLPIQGPPGAGKSHTAAEMILSQIVKGKKVGITALSHKVITGLLEKIVNTAKARKQRLTIVQKIGNDDVGDKGDLWTQTNDNNEVLETLQGTGAVIAAGTPFMWSAPDFFETVDFMFVDEAGQLSLIDTVALSHAAANLVLLGDPQQLKQPQKGTHPEGTEVSALEHILQQDKTILPNKGIFLEETWRLHPAVCNFTSELFYEGRLHPRPGLEKQGIIGHTKFSGAGLFYEPVEHFGNKNSSDEEVERILTIIAELTGGEGYWVDSHGKKQKLTLHHILIIAPYNAQVAALSVVLPNARIGTVDKFQGQEAPVVIFSMSTSTPEDAPRGMEFLYSLNRLNVAVSRAKSTFIMVASPRLFEMDCRSPAQMRLANAFCRFIEMAKG